MKNAGSSSVLSILLASAVAVVGCSDKGQAETPAPTAESADTLTIALVASLSGTDQGVGAEAQRGALTAVAQINALGGVLGKQLVLRVEDDGSQPAVTAQKIRDLADKEKVVFGVGPSTSREALEVLPLIKAEKVLYISPSATSSDLDCLDTSGTPDEAKARCQEYKGNFKWEDQTKPPPPVLFKTSAPNAMLSTAIVQYASENVGGVRRCKSISIVRQADNYGIPISDVLTQQYKLLALLVKDPIDLDPDVGKTQTLKDAAAKVGSAGTDCQVVIALPAVGAAYMRAFREYRNSAPTPLPASFVTIGSDGFRQDQFVVESRLKPSDPASENVSEGSFAVAADTTPQTPQYAQFATLFDARYPNVSPGRYSSTAYDAVIVLAGAIGRTKTTTDVPAVRKAIFEITQGRRVLGADKLGDFLTAAANGEGLDYDGASGTLEFNPKTGNVPNDFKVWQLEGGIFKDKRKFDASVLNFE
jgi:ABC-type branched-subunit amino acid transport system substrate-binding protein